MAPLRVTAFTACSLACFAANSLLCRAALGRGLMDPATFTLVRIGSGAAALVVGILAVRRRPPSGGTFRSAAALFLYAAAFSLRGQSGLGATAFLGERLTPRIAAAGAAILLGVGLTLKERMEVAEAVA